MRPSSSWKPAYWRVARRLALLDMLPNLVILSAGRNRTASLSRYLLSDRPSRQPSLHPDRAQPTSHRL